MSDNLGFEPADDDPKMNSMQENEESVAGPKFPASPTHRTFEEFTKGSSIAKRSSGLKNRKKLVTCDTVNYEDSEESDCDASDAAIVKEEPKRKPMLKRQESYLESFTSKRTSKLVLYSTQKTISEDDTHTANNLADIHEDYGEYVISSKDHSLNSDAYNPFNYVNHLYDHEKNLENYAFVKDVPVVAFINTVQNRPRSNRAAKLFSPHLFVIMLEHGQHKWTIYRRFNHFRSLHQKLIIFTTKHKFHLQQGQNKAIRQTLKDVNLPPLPSLPERLVSRQRLANRKMRLEKFLNELLKIEVFRQHPATLEFLEVSSTSFLAQIGEKNKEGMVKKRSGGRPNACCCGCVKSNWRKRWLVIKDTCIYYITKEGVLKNVLLMDPQFSIEMLGSKKRNSRFLISNSTRTLTVDGWTSRQMKEWFEALSIATSSRRSAGFIEPHMYHSFAPVRSDGKAAWFIDGCDYFQSVATAIKSAKEEIYIADWWLSPELLLVRELDTDSKCLLKEEWRFDLLLKERAEAGVRVYVLLYKEIELALGIASNHSKNVLISSSPNIKVLRHPDHSLAGGTFYWAHHEKVVCIDQTIAYVGGLDICFGRWDDRLHRLVDSGFGGKPVSHRSRSNLLHSKKHVFRMTKESLKHLINSREQLMAGTGDSYKEETHNQHDSSFAVISETSAQIKNLGNAAKQLSSKYWDSLVNKINEWNAIKREISLDDGKKSLNVIVGEDGPIDIEDDDDEIDALEGKLFPGKDYTNIIFKDFLQLNAPFEDFIDRDSCPRMPWHDVGCVVYGSAARDVARHFIQRWNFVKELKAKTDPFYNYLIPKSYVDVNPAPHHFVEDHALIADVQVVRSLSNWSCGLGETEHSILNAYISTIERSQHFIYIENQFFISSTFYNGTQLINKVSDALVRRIIRAHSENTPFMVYIIVPLVPAFPGQIGSTEGTVAQKIQNWMYQTISRGKGSMFYKLHEARIDPNRYVSVCGLRTFSELNSKLVTEIVFSHDKIMLVDDRVTIIGSANINDRSLKGSGDSEIAVVITDTRFVESTVNGDPNYKSGLFGFTLRHALWCEHLGLAEAEGVELDPLSQTFYKEKWLHTAALNTKIYEDVFNVVPTDSVTSFESLRRYRSKLMLAQEDKMAALIELTRVRGYLVLFPLLYLLNEDLGSISLKKESLVPETMWC